MLATEFIPTDHTKRARDKLRNLKQVPSVEKYLPDYKNTILIFADMSAGEKLNRFVDGHKYSVKIEVMKAGCNSVEECSKIGPSVDSVIWRTKKELSSYPSFSSKSGERSPIAIGNLTGRVSSMAQRERRQKNLAKGVCFKRHKVRCRPWKCNLSSGSNNIGERINTTFERSSVVLSDSKSE